MSIRITKDSDLTLFNSLGLPAITSTLIEVFSVRDLLLLSEDGFFEKEKPFVLGEGSNILLKNDLSRPVVKISIPGIRIAEEDENTVLIEAGAGVNWHEFVTQSVSSNFGGIENLALIPGTMGAAPIQNIGAYGVELEQVFESLSCFDMRTSSEKIYRRKDCLFGYRDSIFKRELNGKVIITRVFLRLKKQNYSPNVSYGALSGYLKRKNIHSPAIKDVFDAVISIRRSKLPDPAVLGNAGSFFKNPVVEKSVYDRISTRYPDVPAYPAHDGLVKIPAGWLIEKAGWKGKRIGNVSTYEKQALVIVNHGGATGEEVYNYAMSVKESVRERFGIRLVPEVNILE